MSVGFVGFKLISCLGIDRLLFSNNLSANKLDQTMDNYEKEALREANRGHLDGKSH